MSLAGVLIRFAIYGMLGWCGEILWTSLRDRLTGQVDNWLLIGETSLWSFPMYGSVVFFYEPIHNLLRGQFILVRAVIYLFGFWFAEYLGGWLVWKITGKKPWDYSRSPGGSLNGLIRWNFALVWPFVGLLGEPLHDYLAAITPILLQLK